MNVHVCHSYTFQQTDCHHSKQALSKHILIKRNGANRSVGRFMCAWGDKQKKNRTTNEIGAVTMTKSTVYVYILVIRDS